MSDAAENITSRYPLLEKPEFHATIPDHLTLKLTDHERYLVLSISRIEQQTSWLVVQMMVQNRAVIETDLRVQYLENWKKFILSKWGAAVWVVTVAVPFFGKNAWEWLTKHF